MEIKELLVKWQEIIKKLDDSGYRTDRSLAVGHDPENFNTNNLNLMLFFAMMKDCHLLCGENYKNTELAKFIEANFQCYYDYKNDDYEYTKTLARVFIGDIEESYNRLVMLKEPLFSEENKFQVQKKMNSADISIFLNSKKLLSFLRREKESPLDPPRHISYFKNQNSAPSNEILNYFIKASLPQFSSNLCIVICDNPDGYRKQLNSFLTNSDEEVEYFVKNYVSGVVAKTKSFNDVQKTVNVLKNGISFFIDSLCEESVAVHKKVQNEKLLKLLKHLDSSIERVVESKLNYVEIIKNSFSSLEQQYRKAEKEDKHMVLKLFYNCFKKMSESNNQGTLSHEVHNLGFYLKKSTNLSFVIQCLSLSSFIST